MNSGFRRSRRARVQGAGAAGGWPVRRSPVRASTGIGIGAALLLLLAGCPHDIPEIDVEAPRVISSSPVDSATTMPTITVTFSELMDHESFQVANTFVLVRTEEISSTFVSDVDNPPLIASRQELVETGSTALQDVDGKTVLTFVPARPLEGETSYTYMVSGAVTDRDGNPLVIPLLDENGEEVLYGDDFPEPPGPEEDAASPGGDTGGHPTRAGDPVHVAGTFSAAFLTGPASEIEGPQVIDRFPEAGAANVPPNLAYVQVVFDEPAYNVNNVTFQVVGPDEEPVPSTQVDNTDGRTRATLWLAGNLEESTEYRMVLTSEITDDLDNELDEALNESTFTTASCEDEDDPVIDPEGIEVVPVDTYAIVRWQTNEPSTGLVRYGLSEPDTVVEGGSGRCTLVNYDPCADPPMDAVCVHEVRLEGLEPETEYVFEIESTDAAGNSTLTGVQTFTTLAPLPPLVVNEVMAAPEIAPQEAGEFVEIYNAGTEPVDLDGWIIADSSASPPRTQALAAFGPALTVP
ncbi:MAG: Ig-like domain-containing protein, partial [Myxococcota bacterium]